MSYLLRRLSGLVSLIVLFCASTRAQDTCNFPTSVLPEYGGFFSAEQEMEFGDIVAEQLQRNFHVVEAVELTGYPRRIVDRIVAQLPENSVHFRVYLFDLPTANAFSLPGGRIYISRKMVAFLRNEDELAGLLGHEMGHILSHQEAVNATRMFSYILGVTSVGDRDDIFEKYNELLNKEAGKRDYLKIMAREEEPQQYQADQIALYLLASAGYSPQSFIDFWDRFAQTGGKTGGWLNDLFGITKPAERRLREMQHSLSSLPPACRGTAKPKSDEFVAWQAAVVGFAGVKESLHAILTRNSLTPPLRGDIGALRFSPDGRYALAQDEASIYILTHDPFQFLFRINATDAHQAQFTPDSRSVVFDTPGSRVEKWNLSDQTRAEVSEMVMPGKCLQTSLSPDGSLLACLDTAFDLLLLDVASDSTIFEKKAFFTPHGWTDMSSLYIASVLRLESINWMQTSFSPDARFFVAAHHDDSLAYDLKNRVPVSMHGVLREVLGGGFAFISPDRLVGIRESNTGKSAIVEFPNGEKVSDIVLGAQQVEGATRGNYIFLRPVAENAVGVMDLNTQKLLFSIPSSPAVDVYDQQLLLQRKSGQVGLADLTTRKILSQIDLPQSQLGHLDAVAVSPDFRWLAISEKRRGGVWDLSSGTQVLSLRGFRGAFFDANRNLYADFPQHEKTPRSMIRLDISGQDAIAQPQFEIGQEGTEQHGRFLVVRKPAKEGGETFRNIILQVMDVSSGKTLWSANFVKESPKVFVPPASEMVVLMWPGETDYARGEIKKDAALQLRSAAISDPKQCAYLEVRKATTGATVGRLLVDQGKGSFRVISASSAGDWIMIRDNLNRTLLYSLSSGLKKGSAFGTLSSISPALNLICIENEPGHLSFYALPDLVRRDELVFSGPISYVQFSPDAKRLLVLTSSQEVYILNVAGLNADVSTKRDK